MIPLSIKKPKKFNKPFQSKTKIPLLDTLQKFLKECTEKQVSSNWRNCTIPFCVLNLKWGNI